VWDNLAEGLAEGRARHGADFTDDINMPPDASDGLDVGQMNPEAAAADSLIPQEIFLEVEDDSVKCAEDEEGPGARVFTEIIFGDMAVINAGTAARNPRFLPPCTLRDLYDQYTAQQALSDTVPASLSTFRRVWLRWRPYLKIRGIRQHARCTECASLARWQQLARSKGDETEEKKVKAAQQKHIQDMFHDRSIEHRLQTVSEESCREGCRMPSNLRLLKMDIDGMDESKFALPRNIQAVKSLSNCWRPRTHVVGCIIWGVWPSDLGELR
jgi:hypothetical protein